MRSLPQRISCLALSLIGLLFPADAEEPISRLVVFFSAESTQPKEFLIKNSDGKLLYTSQWKSGIPLYRVLALPGAEYKININGPISAITVGTNLGQSTFLEFGPYAADRGIVGVQIRSWRGTQSAEIENALHKIKEAGDEDAFREVKLTRAEIGASLIFSTDPPWPNPFDEPKPVPKPVPPPPEK